MSFMHLQEGGLAEAAAAAAPLDEAAAAAAPSDEAAAAVALMTCMSTAYKAVMDNAATSGAGVDRTALIEALFAAKEEAPVSASLKTAVDRAFIGAALEGFSPVLAVVDDADEERKAEVDKKKDDIMESVFSELNAATGDIADALERINRRERRVREWMRWIMVFFVCLFGKLLVCSTALAP
jgi:hypothetical protein